MRRTAGVLLLLASLSGCMSVEHGGGGGNPPPSCAGCYGHSRGPAHVPGVQGPYGTPVAMAYPYAASPPTNTWSAYQMMNNSIPLNMVQMHNPTAPGQGSGLMQTGATSYPGADSGILQAQALNMSGMPPGMPPLPPPPGGMLSPPGLPFAPPGMPGMGTQGMGTQGMSTPSTGTAGPNSGVIPAAYVPPGAVSAVGALQTLPTGLRFPVSRTQVQFRSPIGMKVSWYTRGPDGKESYSPFPIEAPGRYNFLQAAVYRLKLTNIPGHPGLEVYPTLEVVPANTRTEAFLAHSSVPVTFTPEDFKQVVAGNYVVKVIYLPDPQYQEVAFTGPGEIVSTQLEPGADPIEEARRRGSILLVIRMGNMDQQAPNTPRIDTPGAGGPTAPGPLMPPGMAPPGLMTPFGVPPHTGVPPLPSHGPFVGGPGAPPMMGLPVPGQPGMPPLPPQMPIPNAGATPPQPPSGAVPPALPQPPTPPQPAGKAGVVG